MRKVITAVVVIPLLVGFCHLVQPIVDTGDLIRKNKTRYEDYYMVDCADGNGGWITITYSATEQYDYIEELHLCESVIEED